jgi:hypothetical protein
MSLNCLSGLPNFSYAGTLALRDRTPSDLVNYFAAG